MAGYYALFVPMLLHAAWQVAAIVLYSVATAAVFCTYLVVRWVCAAGSLVWCGCWPLLTTASLCAPPPRRLLHAA
jgi:hypothetical protein